MTAEHFEILNISPPTPSETSIESRVDSFVHEFVGTRTYEQGSVDYVTMKGYLKRFSKTFEIEKPDSSVRVVIVSDTHEKHDILDLPPGDVFMHCGDVLMRNSCYTKYTSIRKLQAFNEWLSRLPYAEKVVIGGNHDACFQSFGKEALRRILTNCIYLENEYVDLQCGLRVFGTPASTSNTPSSPNKAFQFSAEELNEILHVVPGDTDVLLTHGPVGLLGKGWIDYLRRHRPKLCAFGHVHEDHGSGMLGATVIVNASTMDHSFSPANPPIVTDIAISVRARARIEEALDRFKDKVSSARISFGTTNFSCSGANVALKDARYIAISEQGFQGKFLYTFSSKLDYDYTVGTWGVTSRILYHFNKNTGKLGAQVCRQGANVFACNAISKLASQLR